MCFISLRYFLKALSIENILSRFCGDAAKLITFFIIISFEITPAVGCLSFHEIKFFVITVRQKKMK